MVSAGAWGVHLREVDCDLQLFFGFSLALPRRLPFSIPTTPVAQVVVDSEIIMSTEPRMKGFGG